MKNTNQGDIIDQKLTAYKRKYYKNLAVKGAIISLTLITSYFVLASSLEFTIRFSSLLRGFLLISFIALSLYTLVKYVVLPLDKLLNKKRGISNEIAAENIGKHFPSVGDRLLNLLQLQSIKQGNEGTLVNASIEQKAKDIAYIPFVEAVTFKESTRYVKYLIWPLAIIVLIILIKPELFTSGTKRIVQFNKEFVPEAPFSFSIQNSTLRAFKNEDFRLEVSIDGKDIPESAYLINNGRKIKMLKMSNSAFAYTFPKVKNNKQFFLQAAGFNSETYEINIVERPNIKGFNVLLDYPNYLGKKTERLENIGNLQVPEGTNIKWTFSTINTEAIAIKFSDEDRISELSKTDKDLFEHEKQIYDNKEYEVSLQNTFSENKDKIIYNIDVVKDKFPAITLDTYKDTTLYSYLVLGGNISDDYGLNKLRFYYSVSKEQGKAESYSSLDIPINKTQKNQRYFYQWLLDSVDIKEGEELRYYLQVWDNDGIKGSKSTKTGVYSFKIPSTKEIKEALKTSNENTEKEIDKTIDKAKEIKEDIDELENRLKGKKELNWQDESLLKELIEKREELNKAIKELKEQNQQNNLKKERFTEQDKKIKEKVEQLQKLMDELLDEETKKLYDELKKLLEDKQDINEVQELLDQLDNKEENLEKELERTLELFKRMKFESKLQENIEELKRQAEEQEKLSEKTLDKNNNTEDIKNEQEKLEEDFEELEKDFEELNDLNQDLQSPESLPDNSGETEDIKQEQKDSKNSLEKKQRKKASGSQKGASEKMKKMAEKMESMQGGMEMESMQENLDNLRDIVHNLLKLSFDQEGLINDFGSVEQSDPRFIDLSQQQLKIKDDAKIVEDSLLSLANRVFQIASFVTREVGDMNNYLDASAKGIKDRKKDVALSKQQFAMTSMNNLALLLDDVLEQMQQAMSDAMGKPSKGKGKPKNTPQLSELQQQLNQKIQELKKSGKSGRGLSEELAKLAAEQEKIRKALQEMQKKMNGGDKPGNGIPEKMEETEVDLVNKNITDKTIQRQKDIMTRLLEAEDAMREREKDKEREAETANQYEKQVPKAFEEYFKMKEREIELLKTVPPKLFPYYKKEVNEYFKRIGENENN